VIQCQLSLRCASRHQAACSNYKLLWYSYYVLLYSSTRVVLEYMYTHCTVYYTVLCTLASGNCELELLLAATCLPDELGHALADGQPRQQQSGTVRKPPS
jgi:hypothetical protein